MLPNAPRILLACLAATFLAACTEDAGTGANRPVAAAPVAPQRGFGDVMAEGDRAAASGDLYGAVEAFSQALRLDPASTAAAGRLGLMLSAQGRQAEAVSPLSRAVAANSEDLVLIRALAGTYLGLERPEPAAALLDGAVRQAPGDARLWNALGIARDMLGDSRGAAEAYGAGLAIDAGNKALNTNLALSRQASGDPAGAERAAGLAGLGMADVQARAAALVAYRDRVRARAQAAAPAGAGAVPPMPAMALAPVQVDEIKPVAPPPVAASIPPAPPPTVVAAIPAGRPPAPPAAPPAEPAPAVQAIPPVQALPAVQAMPAAQAVPAATAEAPAAPMQAQSPAAETAAPVLPAPSAATVPPAPAESAPARIAWTDRASAFVQVASYNREGLAEPAWSKLKESHPDLFAGYEAVVQRADLGAEKGVVYRLRIRVSGQGEGVTLCSRMRGAEIDCVVVPAS